MEWECQAWSGAASVIPARDEAQHIAKEVLGVNRRNKTTLCSAQMIRKWLLGWGCWGGRRGGSPGQLGEG